MAPRATFDLDALATSIPTIFDQAQSSAATHRKNCVALYKLQSASAAVVETAEKGRKGEEVRLVGEKVFTEIFLNMLNRVIVVKKGTPNADRIVKFVANYIKFLNDKNVEDNDDDSSTTRFVARLLKHFLKGFQAKSKDVRFRCLNFVSDIVSSLGEIDQDLYSELRTSLLERLCDKESLVRTHCVAALSKLAISEDPNDLEDDEQPIVTSLLDRLFYDPAVEVRRAALIHIPFTPATLPALLTRSRDVDAVTRKLVYATVLPRLAHPKQLTIAQREQIVQQGLGDREEAVRVAAAKLLGSWVDLCEGDLTAFLQLFDVRMTTEVALDALKSVFVTRAEVVQEVEFDDMFWSKLQTETALLARAFVEHCIDTDDQARLEATLPVVTALAFHLQTQCNSFLEILQDAEAMRLQGDGENDDEVETREEQLADAEFVMSELLHLALHLDYTDEIGRRKMFGVVRNMLAHPELPESLITSCIGVLSVMSPNERDLIRLVVEIISELRDRNPGPGADDEDMGAGDETMDGESTIVTAGPTGIPGRSRSRSRRDLHEMSPEEKAEADVTDLRCLCLCIAVLERVHGSFEENSTLEGVLADLIIPSVKRKELALREKGLLGLGLCCLIAKNMALSSFQLFLSQVKSAPESLRIKVLQVIFDIMMTYEKDLLGSVEDIGGRVIAFLMQVLEAEESKGVQALICLGLSKLMLFGLVTDERVLTSLILAYVSPVSAENQELRQCLAYFLPVYCYSSPANQSRMQAIFIAAFDLVTRVYDEMEDDQDMIAPLQFGQLLIDWTDPSKVVGLPNAPNDSSVVHVNLAIDILKALYDNDRAPEDRKTLCQLLAKLVLPPDAEQPVLYTLYILVANLIELCPFEDTATDKAFLRFKARLEKHFSAMLRDYDEQACFQEEAYEEVFEFIGITRPKQRRFEGQVTADASAVLPSDGEAEGAPSKVKRGRQSTKPKTKKATEVASNRSASSSSAESKSESEDDIADETPGPSRSRKGKGTTAASLEPAAASPDSEDESAEEEPVLPPPKNGKAKKASSPKYTAASNDESDASGSAMSEVKENLPVPSTPPRKKGAKRMHTPSRTPSMPSPAPKRQNRGAALPKNGRKGKLATAKEPLTNATNRHNKSKAAVRVPAPSKPSTRGRGRPPKLMPPIARPSSMDRDEAVSKDSEMEEDDSDSDVPPSDASMPLARYRNARAAPRAMEEKAGWGDSSDI